MSISPEIQALRDRFAADLENLVRSAAIEAVKSVLGGAPAKAAVAAPPKSAKTAKTASKPASKKPVIVKLASAPAKAVAAKPAAAASKTAPKPAAKPAAKPVAKLAAKPTAKPVAKLAAKPASADVRIRRTTAELEQAAHRVREFIRSKPGTSAETVKAALNIDAKIWQDAIGRLTAKGEVTRRGEKRSAVYSFSGR